MSGQHPCDMQKRLGRAKRVQQERNIRPVQHHPAQHHELLARRPHAVEICAQLASVERRRRKRAPAVGRARLIGDVIGMRLRCDERDIALCLEIVERLRPRFQEGLALLIPASHPDHGGQKPSCGVH